MSVTLSQIERHVPPPAHASRVADQLDQWMARLEAAQDRIFDQMRQHEQQPWHISFQPMNAQLERRLDRLENLVMSVARWMIGVLLAILASLGAILVVAWRILEGKP